MSQFILEGGRKNQINLSDVSKITLLEDLTLKPKMQIIGKISKIALKLCSQEVIKL